MIVVQFQRADVRGVGLEREHHNVAHQPHVLVDVLRRTVSEARQVGLSERRAPALQSARLARAVDLGFDIANRRKILVQSQLVGTADPISQTAGFFKHGVGYDPC